MCTYCGVNCDECPFKSNCKGCKATCGKPFGGKCIAAEYIKFGGIPAYEAFQEKLIKEINDLTVEGMPEVSHLNALAGFYVNLAYPLPNGETVKMLDDKRIYLGAQLCCGNDGDEGPARCFGVVADTDFILVCQYGEMGSDPELVLFKRR